MTRELKRDPSGHYARSQWVISGFMPARPADDLAYYTQYLWETGPPMIQGGITGPDKLRQLMEDDAAEKVADLRALIAENLREFATFTIGPVTVYFRYDCTTGYCTHVMITRGDVDIMIASDFAENWEAGDLAEEIEDRMMAAAISDKQLAEDAPPLCFGGGVESEVAEPEVAEAEVDEPEVTPPTIADTLHAVCGLFAVAEGAEPAPLDAVETFVALIGDRLAVRITADIASGLLVATTGETK